MAIELNGDALLAGYQILVLKESIKADVEISDYPVETGFNISDHVEPIPPTLELTAIIARPTVERAQKAVDELEKKMFKGERVVYKGKKIFPDMCIQSFKYERDKSIKNGFIASISLKKIRVASPAFVKLPTKPKTQVKPVTAAGRKQTQNKKKSPVYHVIKKGDTYWALGKKYGVSWQQIEKWNTYPARSIPIGAKVRVG